MAKLTIARGSDQGQEHVLGTVTTIGRSMEADIRVDDLTVSRKHAEIAKSDEGYMLRDLGSGNGTMLNNERIGGPTLLQHNDQIGVCNVLLTFTGDGDTAIRKAKGVAGSATLEIVDKAEGAEAIVGSVDVDDQEGIAGQPDAKTGLDELRLMHRRLKTVLDVGNAISTVLDEQRQLQLIMERLFDVFAQADRGFIILMDPKTRRLRPTVGKIREGEGGTQQISISRTIAKEVIDKRRAVLSSDAMGDERFAGGASIVNFRIRSMMCVPLLAQDQILGLIHIDTMRPTEHFTGDDLNLLAAIANQAALAVSNARLHSQLLTQDRMQRDLELATRVQKSFLPDSLPEIEGFEFKQAYKAALDVGGDFYDFIQLGETEWGIVVGDVSGKGVSAALLMAKLMSEVRVSAQVSSDPATVLGNLNARLAAGGTEDIFVTLLFMKLETDTKRLTISNAGHLPPVVRRGQDGTVLRLEESLNYPLGVLDDTEFEQSEFQLQSGDAVAAFTDGIIEAMNAEKEQYGFERFEAAMDSQDASPAELTQIVLDDVRKFVGKTDQSDDLTLVCFGVL